MVLGSVLKELGPVTGPTIFLYSSLEPQSSLRLSLKPPSSLHCSLEPQRSLRLKPGCRAPTVLCILEPHLITPGAA